MACTVRYWLVPPQSTRCFGISQAEKRSNPLGVIRRVLRSWPEGGCTLSIMFPDSIMPRTGLREKISCADSGMPDRQEAVWRGD